MTERVKCESCGLPMAAVAVRCPHCAAMQKRSPTSAPQPRGREPAREERARPVLKDVTSEEARALLAIADARTPRAPEGEESFNILAWMFLPDPRSRGAAQVAELVLTFIALPALLSAFVGAAFAMRAISRARRAGGARAIAGALLGAGFVGLSAIASFAGASYGAIAVICGAPMLALLVREGVRGWVRNRHSVPDLTR